MLLHFRHWKIHPVQFQNVCCRIWVCGWSSMSKSSSFWPSSSQGCNGARLDGKNQEIQAISQAPQTFSTAVESPLTTKGRRRAGFSQHSRNLLKSKECANYQHAPYSSILKSNNTVNGVELKIKSFFIKFDKKSPVFSEHRLRFVPHPALCCVPTKVSSDTSARSFPKLAISTLFFHFFSTLFISTLWFTRNASISCVKSLFLPQQMWFWRRKRPKANMRGMWLCSEPGS